MVETRNTHDIQKLSPIRQFEVKKFSGSEALVAKIIGEWKGIEPHGSFCILGDPGIGKSSFLRMMEAAVLSDPALNERLIPIYIDVKPFASLGVVTVPELFWQTQQSLIEKVEGEGNVSKDHFLTYKDKTGSLSVFYGAVDKVESVTGKRVLLLLDNIDEITKISDRSLHTLSNIFNSGVINILMTVSLTYDQLFEIIRHQQESSLVSSMDILSLEGIARESALKIIQSDDLSEEEIRSCLEQGIIKDKDGKIYYHPGKLVSAARPIFESKRIAKAIEILQNQVELLRAEFDEFKKGNRLY